MRIAICGCGVVGRATGEGFARLGHEVFTYDTSPERAQVPWGQALKAPRSPDSCDVVFFCTPEEAAPQAVREWVGPELRVVRSSTMPGTVRGLEGELGRPVVHNPELLREVTALGDFLNPSYILIGRSDGASTRPLEDLYRPFQAPIVFTDQTTSEMVKLATNGILSTLIAYWMDVDQLCGHLGISSHEVGMIASRDPRVPTYGARQHNEYGGRCLPKDMRHLLDLAERLKTKVPVLRGAKEWSA